MTARSQRTAALLGASAAFLARSALRRALLHRLRRDVAALNRGDYRPTLAGYARDAVLVGHDGWHRWSGEHYGRSEIETFLRQYVDAGLNAEVCDLLIGGAPWRLTAAVRLDDHADDPDGQRAYDNRTVLYVRTRWGKIVRHDDFFADTECLERFDKHLRDRTEGDGSD